MLSMVISLLLERLLQPQKDLSDCRHSWIHRLFEAPNEQISAMKRYLTSHFVYYVSLLQQG